MTQATCLDAMPTSYIVVDALNNHFAEKDIDLRDIKNIAMQDPVVMANIFFLINEFSVKRGSSVINTISAAINLVGLSPLKNRLLSIEAIKPEDERYARYELIRNRIYFAACLTQFWADYMGQTTSEEMYCTSMFTGFTDLYKSLQADNNIEATQVDLENKESILCLFMNAENEIKLMPDNIQNLIQTKSIPERMKLSILTYDLMICLEYGYSTEDLNKALLALSDYVGIGIHRAGYDLARQLVSIERSTHYHIWSHSRFLLSSNMQVVDPIK